jgi:hypothetical protein
MNDQNKSFYEAKWKPKSAFEYLNFFTDEFQLIAQHKFE